MKAAFLLFHLLLLFSAETHANYTRTLPIAHAGRYQPLAVYANQWFYELSHQNTLPASMQSKGQPDLTPLSFLWQLHFRGHLNWQDMPLFWIGQADLKKALALPINGERFTFRQIKEALADLQQKSPPPSAFPELERIMSVTESFSRQGSTIEEANRAYEGTFLMLKQQALPPAEIALQLEMQFPLASRLKQAGDLLKIIPGKFKSGEWFSPHAFHIKVYNPKTEALQLVDNFTLYPGQLFQQIQQAYFEWEKAFLAQDHPSMQHWEKIVATLLLDGYSTLAEQPYARASGKYLSYPSRGQLLAEELYFNIPLVFICLAIYACATLSFLLSDWLRKKSLATLGLSLAVFGFLCHTAILALRCYILGRPPVTNMLETVLYVPWVSISLGLALTFVLKNRTPLLAALIAGEGLLLILNMSYLGERFENVQAVLDSQYWLIIHVLMVVGSYGIYILSAILGHWYLSVAIFGKNTSTFVATGSEQQPLLAKAIIQTMYLGTGLLVGGTLLGGVWAAQSWGRFWDWDPKESWAFISICIYLLWIHAYRFHKIDNFGLAVGSILGVVMISFTWYGVNYILGTGLHSYGFGTGGRWIYYGYLYAELLFVTTTTTVAWKRGLWNKKLAKNPKSMV